MKLVYNIYSMPIGRYSLMDKTGNTRLISRIWMPKKIRLFKYAELQVEVSKMFKLNPLDNEIQKLWMLNKIILMKAVYTALTISRVKSALDYFEENYGEFRKLSDLKILAADIKRMEGKLREINSSQKGASEKQDFEMIISGVELILDRSLNRSLTLFEFNHQYKLAMKKAKASEKK